MQKYLALIIAGLLGVIAVAAGIFHIIPVDQVNTILGLVVVFILGHVSGLTQEKSS